MNNLPLTFEEKKKIYNNVPVAYCEECMSLRIRFTSDETDFCDNCGGVHISYVTIDEWKELFNNKYGEEINKESNGE